MWKSAPELLRQEDTTNPGFIMWGCKNISGGGSPSVIVQEVREQLDWLADNPFYTKRFAYYVGRKCRTMTVKNVAKELKLDWHTVKALDKEYMQKQLQRNPIAAPGVVGIDERSLRRGHTYRIVVSDLERGRPIWYGGEDRSEESPDMFYEWLGPKKMKKIRLAVTDMWKAFKKSTKRNVPQAAILFDKFHIFLSPKSI